MTRVKSSRAPGRPGPPRASLRAYARRYARLKAQLRALGFICLGSLRERWFTCGKPGCRCQQHPAQPHGPYYHWTRKVAGRTEGRILSAGGAPLYRQGIRNHRRLDTLLAQMREVSLLAFQAAKLREKG